MRRSHHPFPLFCFFESTVPLKNRSIVFPHPQHEKFGFGLHARRAARKGISCKSPPLPQVTWQIGISWEEAAARETNLRKAKFWNIFVFPHSSKVERSRSQPGPNILGEEVDIGGKGGSCYENERGGGGGKPACSSSSVSRPKSRDSHLLLLLFGSMTPLPPSSYVRRSKFFQGTLGSSPPPPESVCACCPLLCATDLLSYHHHFHSLKGVRKNRVGDMCKRGSGDKKGKMAGSFVHSARPCAFVSRMSIGLLVDGGAT